MPKGKFSAYFYVCVSIAKLIYMNVDVDSIVRRSQFRNSYLVALRKKCYVGYIDKAS